MFNAVNTTPLGVSATPPGDISRHLEGQGPGRGEPGESTEWGGSLDPHPKHQGSADRRTEGRKRQLGDTGLPLIVEIGVRIPVGCTGDSVTCFPTLFNENNGCILSPCTPTPQSIAPTALMTQDTVPPLRPNDAGVSTLVQAPPGSLLDENGRVGLLLSSKALVQLLTNPLVGVVTSHVGYSLPLFVGLINLLVAALLFAFGERFASLLIARSLQGVASACIGVSGMCLVAEQYPDESTRSRVMGVVLGSIALGVLLGYPMGGLLYDFVDKMAPFLIIAVLALLDGVMQLFVLDMKTSPEVSRTIFSISYTIVHGTGNDVTPSRGNAKRRLVIRLVFRDGAINVVFVGDSRIWQPSLKISVTTLLSDGVIVVTAGAIWLSTSSMAILEPCLPIWLMDNLKPQRWQLGMVFLPDSVGYLLGTNCFGAVAYRLGWQWKVAVAAMMLVGVSTFLVEYISHNSGKSGSWRIPSARGVAQLAVPHFGLGLGIGVVDAALVPMLASLVDARYGANYGSVYALQQSAVSLAYCLGPLFGGLLARSIGFPWLMRSLGLVIILYCPLLAVTARQSATVQFQRSSLLTDVPAVNYKTNEERNGTDILASSQYRRFLNSDTVD
uniref:(California timema) hypothetical protein n=1 Tax=Timema californicum TaxID=61474 RepID=A0A7R9JC87_TIMCA|nr:unnamed protein product [Timema californicum]